MKRTEECCHDYHAPLSAEKVAVIVHYKSSGSKIETCFPKIVFDIVWYDFVFVIQQYNLNSLCGFSLIDCDPKVSLLLAGIAMSLAENLSVRGWSENDSVD